MVVNMYAVRDTLAGIYMPPVLGDSDAAMIRSFGDAVTKGDTPISAHPEDYTLEKIGSFDKESGMVVSCPIHVLCHGSDFMKDK